MLWVSSARALTQIETFILEQSQIQPVSVARELEKLSSQAIATLPAKVLVEASFASAVNLDAALTLRLTEQLLDESKRLNDTNLAGQAFYNRGVLHAALGHHDLALDSLRISLANFENCESEVDIARVKGALALMYVEIGEYELAQPYFADALASHQLRNDQLNMAKVLQNRGFMKIQIKDYVGAKEDLTRALKFSQSVDLRPIYPIIYKNLGKVESLQGSPELALEYFDKAIAESTSSNLEYHQSEIMRELALLQLRNGLVEKARRSLATSLQLGEKFNLLKQLKLSYLALAQLEVSLENYKAAYLANEEATKISHQMGDDRVARNLSRLDKYSATLKEQNKRLVLEKEKEIVELAAQRDQLLRNFSISVAVIAILLALYFIRRFTDTNKQAALFERQSKIDSLTGVWNRRAGRARLSRLCQREERADSVFSIAMLDIDHFKRVNDDFGHDIGDKVIVEICHIIEKNLRPSDMVCRWGGEEFILILESSSAAEAKEICERIRSTVEQATIESVGEMAVSIGIAQYRGASVDELVKRGDLALYQAKHQGRNRVVLDPETGS